MSVWRLAGNLWESVLSIHWSTPGTELGSKRLCPLSHLHGSPSWSPGSFLISPLFPRHLSPRMPCLARQTSERDQGVAPETAAGAQGLHLPLLRDKPFLPDRPWFPWCSPVVGHKSTPSTAWLQLGRKPRALGCGGAGGELLSGSPRLGTLTSSRGVKAASCLILVVW